MVQEMDWSVARDETVVQFEAEYLVSYSRYLWWRPRGEPSVGCGTVLSVLENLWTFRHGQLQ